MVSRDRLIRIAVVTAISLVVWVWAARTTTGREDIDSTIRVSLPARLTGQSVLMSPLEPFTVKLAVRGLKSDLNRAQLRLGNVSLAVGDRGVPIGGDDDTPFDAETLTRVLQGRLDDDDVDVRVVSIEGVIPPLEVEPIEERTLVIGTNLVPVARETPAGALVVARAPGIDPPSVTIRGPRSSFSSDVTFRAEARIDRGLFLSREPGREYLDRVPIQILSELPPAVAARIIRTPENATVSYRIAERAETLSLGADGVAGSGPGVPVQVALPAPDIARFDVTIDSNDAFLRNVVLRGSPESLEQIRQGRFTVIAFVQLSSNELDRATLEGGTIVKAVGFWQLPAGVTVIDPGRTATQMEAVREGQPVPPGIVVQVRRRAPG